MRNPLLTVATARSGAVRSTQAPWSGTGGACELVPPFLKAGRDRVVGRRRCRISDLCDGSVLRAATRARGRFGRASSLRPVRRQGLEDPGGRPRRDLRGNSRLRRMRGAPEAAIPRGRLRQEVCRSAAAGRMDPRPSGWSTGHGDSRDRNRLFSCVPLERAADAPRSPRQIARGAASRGSARTGARGEGGSVPGARELPSPIRRLPEIVPTDPLGAGEGLPSRTLPSFPAGGRSYGPPGMGER